MTVPTNVTQTAGLQTLNDDAGRPLFVVLPVAEYLRLKQRNEPTIPHEVVNLRFEGKGKSGSGRTIVCYQKGDKAIYVHGFAKNEKSNPSKKELIAFKEFAKVLLELSDEKIQIALQAGDFIEVKP